MSNRKTQFKIGKTIREFRETRELSVGKFAEFLGVTAGTISQIEGETIGVSSTILMSIKKAFPDTDMNRFFEEDNDERT